MKIFPDLIQDKINFYLWRNDFSSVLIELKQTDFIYGTYHPLNSPQIILDMFHRSWDTPTRKYRRLRHHSRLIVKTDPFVCDKFINIEDIDFG